MVLAGSGSSKTIFLDRDGVINRKMSEGDYVKCRDEFKFLPGVKEALRMLKEAGHLLIVVTNQRGVARGLMTEDELREIHGYMQQELDEIGASLDGIYYCPHEKGQCNCRKPELGLFLKAKYDFPSICFANSIMIGDSINDMEAGVKIGCKNVLVADTSQNTSIVNKAYNQGIDIEIIIPTLYDILFYLDGDLFL